MPARTISLCEIASASAGGSLRVGRKAWLKRVTRGNLLRSGAAEAAPCGGRCLLVEENLVRLSPLSRFVLHASDLLRRQVTGVFGLDLGQPGRALARFVLVELDLAAVERLVDLLEEGVDEVLLGDLAQRLAMGVD